MTEYQRGLEAAAKKVKELWHHPYADELAAAIRGLSSTDFGSSNLPPTAAVGAPKGNSVGDLQSSGGKLGFIAHCLACRAKELVEGMQSRCKRLPDRADFLAAFEDELKKGLTPQEFCPTCGSEDKGIFDSTAPNLNKHCWAKGFHDPWHDGGLTPQPERGDPTVGRTIDEERRPLVCFVCGERFGITFNFCLEHKDEYENAKVAYGKLFNENAELTGWLEEADAKLASLGYYRQGAGYVLIEDND